MKLNAMLTKNQIICCGMMNISFLEFEPWNGHTLLSDRGCKKLQPFADHSRADLPGRRADQHSWLDHDARFLLSASLVRHESHRCAPAPINARSGIKGPTGMYS